MSHQTTSPLDSASQHLLEQWMKVAIEVAQEGIFQGENPFGAVICSQTEGILVSAYNTVISTRNPSAHAEINALAKASQIIGPDNLCKHWLVTTAEPCPMCLSAAAVNGITHVAFGANQAVVTEAGYFGLGITGRELATRFSRSMTLRGSIRGNACVALLLNNRKRNP